MPGIKKKTIIIVFVLLFAMLLCVVAPVLFQVPVIGKVSGAEWEYVEIDGMIYVKDDLIPGENHSFSAADRGRYLGAVKNGDTVMRVFDVKGDDTDIYLYVLWKWEGSIYVRQK